MKIVIIEDEYFATKRIVNILQTIYPELDSIPVIEDVNEGIKWFKNNEHPDLIISDIELGDGSCFDIFNSVKINSFIIFTTAYNEHVLQAFKMNSVDYLIKPIDATKLKNAIEKFKKYYQTKDFDYNKQIEIISKINKTLLTPSYKKNYLVKKGDQYYPVSVDDIQCIFSDMKTVQIASNNTKYFINESLDTIEKQLRPDSIFRINQSCIISRKNILSIETFFNNRLLLKTNIKSNVINNADLFIVSRRKTKEFKEWMNF